MSSTALSSFSVYRTLDGATTTHLERATPLGAGLAAAQWVRDGHDQVLSYEMPGHHTLSLYLEGGERSFRIGKDGFGGAGKVCVLPDEHRSRWNMSGNVRFLHLYIAPERLAQEAILRMDREPRTLELCDRTYIQAPALSRACRDLLSSEWDDPSQRLAASSAAETLLHHLLSDGTARRQDGAQRGGLAPAVRRRVRDYIDSHLDAPLTLEELAGVAALSTYHFARMFPVSFGETPHAWVQRRRVERVRQLLAVSDLDLAGIAQRTGFGNASHLSRCFRQLMGATPGAYRRYARGR